MEISLKADIAALTDLREPWVHALAFDAASERLAIAIPEVVFVHDLQTGGRKAEYRPVRHGDATRLGMPRDVAFGGGGRDLVVAVSVPDKDGFATENRRTLQLFREGSSEPRAVLPRESMAGITAWALDPTGARLVVATADSDVHLFDLDTLEGGLLHAGHLVPEETILAVALAHAGKAFAFASIWTGDDAYACRVCAFAEPDAEPSVSHVEDHVSFTDVRDVHFTPDDSVLVVLGQRPSWSVGTLAVDGSAAMTWRKVRSDPDSVIWVDRDGSRTAALVKERTGAAAPVDPFWLELQTTASKSGASRVPLPDSQEWAVNADATRYAYGSDVQVVIGELGASAPPAAKRGRSKRER
jgi:hypothetical protein